MFELSKDTHNINNIYNFDLSTLVIRYRLFLSFDIHQFWQNVSKFFCNIEVLANNIMFIIQIAWESSIVSKINSVGYIFCVATIWQGFYADESSLVISFFFYIARGFHRKFATGAACQQRPLTPPDTWSCPTLGLASVLMLRPMSPELVLFPDFWVLNIPRYFCFCLPLLFPFSFH